MSIAAISHQIINCFLQVFSIKTDIFNPTIMTHIHIYIYEYIYNWTPKVKYIITLEVREKRSLRCMI